MATVKVTVLPAAGLLGDQASCATRSELATGLTTSCDAAVKLLLVSLCSMTVLASSTLPVTE